MHRVRRSCWTSCLETYFKTMTDYKLKLHPGKFVLYNTRLVWGGKLVSAEGTRPNPKKVPENGGSYIRE